KAQLKQSNGDVSVKRAAGDDWVAAPELAELFENDKVRTAKGAAAVIRVANGSEVQLGEDALIAIAETRTRPGTDRTDLTVFKGRINAELDAPGSQSLTVSTPSATVRAGREIVFQ
ncbi:MAG: FecR domain-containing protein, partial [Myxococcaceae bacterium]